MKRSWKLLLGFSVLLVGCQSNQSLQTETTESLTGEMPTNQQVAVANLTPTTQTFGLGKYADYNQEAYDQADISQRVLFFHAKWCPTCKAAEEEFKQRISDIPESVVIFKTDYDTQAELKKKFNITYQHTFVLVDANGEQITQWNGGAIDELISNIQ